MLPLDHSMVVGGTMKYVLLEIANRFSWLFEENQFRIIDSLWQDDFGGQDVVGVIDHRFFRPR